MIIICLNRFPYTTEPENLIFFLDICTFFFLLDICTFFFLLIEQNNLISYSEAAKALCRTCSHSSPYI